MAWLFSLINKIWNAFMSLLIGIFFVLPLFTMACITTLAATGFLTTLILAKCISDGGHRLTQWWFSGDDTRLVYIPPQPNKATQSNGVQTSRHSSGAGSQSSNGTPARSNRSTSSASLSSMPNPNRDYEGVGGWKTTLDESDQSIFLNMNSGLELSSPSRRRRSFGASSVISSGFNSPELINTPMYGYARNASGSLRRMSGTGSPQSYFNVPVGGSMINIGSRRSSRALYNERVRVERENGNGSEGTEDENAVV